MFKRNQWFFVVVCLFVICCTLYSFQLIRLLVFKQETISVKQFPKNFFLFWRCSVVCCLVFTFYCCCCFSPWYLASIENFYCKNFNLKLTRFFFSLFVVASISAGKYSWAWNGMQKIAIEEEQFSCNTHCLGKFPFSSVLWTIISSQI